MGHSQENWNYIANHEGKYNLDKDILVKGNRKYSPETCCIVPNRVNLQFRRNRKHNNGLPIGVSYHHNNYESHCGDGNGNSISHTFSNPMDAFMQYKKDKENIIKRIANEEYEKGSISKKCYIAMINYQVEITD